MAASNFFIRQPSGGSYLRGPLGQDVLRGPFAFVDADAAAASDGGEAIALVDADIAAAVDAGEAVTVSITDTDTATAVDAGEALAAAATDADTAASVDGGETVTVGGVSITDADAATADDSAAAAVGLSDAETALAGESAAIALGDAEAATGADTETVAVSGSLSIADGDTGIAAEVEAYLADLTASDLLLAFDTNADYQFLLGPQTRYPTPTIKPAHNSQQRTANRLMRYFTSIIQEEANLYLLTDGTITSTQPWDAATIVKAWYGGHVNLLTPDDESRLVAAGYVVTRTET